MASQFIHLPQSGVASWRNPVATSASLPVSGNTLGDAIAAEDTGVIYVWTGSSWTAPAGSGTVTSVALTVPAWLTVAGSPVTGAGTLAVIATSGQTANQFLATPNGSTGTVGLREIVGADLPLPGAASLGGVFSKAAVTHQFLTAIVAADESVTSAQPAFTDISGSVAAGQMPALTGDVTTSAGAVATSLVATTNATLTTLSGLTTASALVTVGTIATGVWAGTAIAAAHGGTGISTASSTGIAQVSSGTWSVAALTVAQMTIGTVAIGTVTTTATVTWSSGNVFTMLLTNSDTCVVSFSGAVSGQTIVVKVAQPASTGSGVITWPTAYWAGGTIPTMTTGGAAIDVYTFVYDGTNFYGSAVQNVLT